MFITSEKVRKKLFCTVYNVDFVNKIVICDMAG